ncbi:hypothetical protein M2212_003170 [Bradyrhizobium elkanii]|jgi:beta-alanine degradation protein BauB|uniref:hypothetical protein n=1 Tax=Bradyrhizobium elkanii TaxID=29448 RepID=UPI0021685C7F|nr:hypothetical protein [Bradyrhizobium elkanii]MCS3476324.1 hypothetical protein [Bradyrhizobium elkanii]
MSNGVAEKSKIAWPDFIRKEFEANQFNGRVGTRLLSETKRVRVWEIRLAPGERIGFHRHVLDYFWTAVTPGRARSHAEDGTIVEAVYSAGEMPRGEQDGSGASTMMRGLRRARDAGRA